MQMQFPMAPVNLGGALGGLSPSLLALLAANGGLGGTGSGLGGLLDSGNGGGDLQLIRALARAANPPAGGAGTAANQDLELRLRRLNEAINAAINDEMSKIRDEQKESVQLLKESMQMLKKNTESINTLNDKVKALENDKSAKSSK
jgi:hypothetical protein